MPTTQINANEWLIPITDLGEAIGGLSTLRQGGFSSPPFDSMNLGTHVADDPKAVQANRNKLRLLLPNEPVWLNQVHGNHVYRAEGLNQLQNQSGSPPTADAAVTIIPKLPLAILTADCLPIVLADQAGLVLGVAHAGWRGLANGVIEATLDAMRLACPKMRLWSAWVGPGIGFEAFQVGSDVYDTFTRQNSALSIFFKPDGREQGKWMADLSGLAEYRLTHLGAHSVVVSPFCTFSSPDRFFSFRRDGQSGRMATVAWLR